MTAARAQDETLIRPATERDAATIHALIVELSATIGQTHKVSSRPRDFTRYGFTQRPAFEALIAETHGEASGLALYFYNFSSWRGELGVYLQDLFVRPAARGAGLGRALLRETARRAQTGGATHLRLSVDRHNAAAIRFYESLGVTRALEECIFEADGGTFARLMEEP